MNILLGFSRGSVLTYVVMQAFSINTFSGVFATIGAISWFIFDLNNLYGVRK